MTNRQPGWSAGERGRERDGMFYTFKSKMSQGEEFPILSFTVVVVLVIVNLFVVFCSWWLGPNIYYQDFWEILIDWIIEFLGFARLLSCFTDPLIAWTFYCSSDHPVCRAAWAFASHGRHECIQFIIRYHLYCSNSDSSREPFSPHHHLISQDLLAFRTGVFNPKRGFSNIRKYWCWLKLQYSFSYPNISFLCKFGWLL